MNNKRTIGLFVIFAVLFFTSFTGTGWAAEPVGIILDGATVETDVLPYIDENNRTMVPARFVTEALGCLVNWVEEERKVLISRPGINVELYIGKPLAYVNGTEGEMDTTAVIKGERTMVPLRFLAETFGLTVSWEEKSRTVILQKPIVAPPGRSANGTPVDEVIVIGDVVNIRTGPGTDYSRLAQVDAGTRLGVLAESSGWFQVEIPGRGKGWIAGWLVEPAGEASLGKITLLDYDLPAGITRSALIMKDLVNVRSAPGLEHSILSGATLGQQLDITGEQDGWLAVNLPGGHSGWIAGYLAAVRYDTPGGDSTGAGKENTAGLISRWQVGSADREQNKPGNELSDADLPLITSMEVERFGDGLLLTVGAAASTGLPASFRLDNPSRLVFDFTARLEEEGPAPLLPVNHGPVSCFRLGQFDDRTVRIVADLQGPASYALSKSTDGRIITVQVQPINPHKQIIVIDPGHGALQPWGDSDPGAIGPTGLREREVVRSISLELGNILLNEGYTIIYTRENDTDLSLEDRAAVACITGAELLISIHANASTNRDLSGTMTFYHAPVGSNWSGQVQDRQALAGFIQAELLNRLQREDKGVRQAAYAVLRNCPLPAALVEVAFISNKEEERLLADPTFQKRAAEAIALGIKRYLSTR